MPKTPTLPARLLKPYLSLLVLAQPVEGGSREIVLRAIRSFIADDPKAELVADGLSNQPTVESGASTTELAICYVTHRRPPWGGLSANTENLDVMDREHHLVLVVQRGALLAIHSTDARLKEHLLRLQSKLQLGGVGLLKREALEEAFLQGEIATFWMGEGVVAGGQRGPKSKTTYGTRLEDTIDVIGDQRHTLAGARATVGATVLGDGQEGVLGANLERSSFWLRRSRDLLDFLDTTDRLLDAVQRVLDAGGGHERFVVFARYIDDIDAVENAYDLSVTDPAAVAGATPTAEEVDAYDWVQTRIASVTASGRRTARIVVMGDDGTNCTAALRPDRKATHSIDFTVSHTGGSPEVTKKFENAVKQLDVTLFYESGHAVTRRGVLMEHFSDIPFGGWNFVDFGTTDVGLEKPGKGTREAIRTEGGTARDRSLFGWIIRSTRAGWLYCDDGAEELCDFIHLDEQVDRLTIWHAKACKAGPDRKIAAVPYEQVCAQASKNIASLSHLRLAAYLEQRQARGVLGPLWLDGKASTAVDRFINALREPRANLAVTVNVLQAHVTEALLLAARSGGPKSSYADAERLRRLDHLLLATDDAVSKLGGHLRVITARR